MRKKIYTVITENDGSTKIGSIYDFIMIITIVASMIPLAMKAPPRGFLVVERVATSIYIFDYILRLLTADYRLKKGIRSFILYPFTPMAIIDILSILPFFIMTDSSFRALRVLRVVNAFRAFRIIRILRYSKNIRLLKEVFIKQRDSFLVVAGVAFSYILVTSLVMFNVEPDIFDSYFDALYWATVTLTTVGYGDVYPESTLGKLITMASTFMGIAIIALPAGIITSGLLKELENNQ